MYCHQCYFIGTTHSDILSQNISIIDEVISNPTQANDASSMQPGSSLGSLFLDSVDEILSHEKTTHLQFASPQTQAPTQRQKPKAKKPVQQKATIDSSPVCKWCCKLYVHIYVCKKKTYMLKIAC